jgi:hypothetical protein
MQASTSVALRMEQAPIVVESNGAVRKFDSPLRWKSFSRRTCTPLPRTL